MMRPANVHVSSTIGSRVQLAPTASVGPNCYIDGCTKIGENTTLVGGVTLLGDAEIGDNCTIEPGVSITNSFAATANPDGCVRIGAGTRVGAGSVLARGVTIGAHATIDVGAFVSRNVPSYAIVSGNPAGIVGYDTHEPSGAGLPSEQELVQSSERTSSVEGVRFYQFPLIADARGDLSVAEFDASFPFQPKRSFVVFNVPAAANRGEHAHYSCQEILICLRGSVVVVVDDGARREEIELSNPQIGLYLAPMVWRVQYRYSPSCIVLVVASSHYEPADYIRDYDQFLVERQRRA